MRVRWARRAESSKGLSQAFFRKFPRRTAESAKSAITRQVPIGLASGAELRQDGSNREICTRRTEEFMSQQVAPTAVPPSSNPAAEPRVPATWVGRMTTGLILRSGCPRCASERVYRSRRRSWFERILALIALPYRCEFCSLRFFRLRWVAPAR